MARYFKVSGSAGQVTIPAKNESEARAQYKRETGCYSQTKVERA